MSRTFSASVADKAVDGGYQDCCSLERAKRILFVLGTRPEAIKLAPLFREMSTYRDFCCRLCVTGQHRELLASVLDLFELQPDWNLDIMRPAQDLAYLTAAALSGI